MFPADWVLALLLLTGPAPANDIRSEMFKRLHVPMTALAIHLEVMDKRETRYILLRESDFNEDIRKLRSHITELRGAPFMKDASRFPDRKHLNDMLVLNRSFLAYVEQLHRIGLVDQAELAVVRQETNRLYEVWDCALDVQCQYYFVTVRRLCLRRLHTLLGENDYRQGKLPPPIPFWRLGLFARPVVRLP
jgi:hypothetical protein